MLRSGAAVEGAGILALRSVLDCPRQAQGPTAVDGPVINDEGTTGVGIRTEADPSMRHGRCWINGGRRLSVRNA
jgi:hypothetical protein